MKNDWVKENILPSAQSDKITELLKFLRNHQIVDANTKTYTNKSCAGEFKELFKAFFVYWLISNNLYPNFESPAVFVEIDGYNTLLLIPPYSTRTLYINSKKRFNMYINDLSKGYSHHNCNTGYCAIYQCYRINHSQLWGKTNQDSSIINAQKGINSTIDRTICDCRTGVDTKFKKLLVKNPELGISLGGFPIKIKCSSFLIKDITEFFASEVIDTASFLACVNSLFFNLCIIYLALSSKNYQYIGSESKLKLTQDTLSNPIDGLLVLKNNEKYVSLVFEFTTQSDTTTQDEKKAERHFRKTIFNFKVTQTFFTKKLNKRINFIYISPKPMPNKFSKNSMNFLASEDIDFRYFPLKEYLDRMLIMYQSEDIEDSSIDLIFESFVKNLESASGILDVAKRKKFILEPLPK